jgi:hypothetical protein
MICDSIPSDKLIKVIYMKRSFLIMTILSVILCSQAIALPTPKPIKGSAAIVSKSFSAGAGEFVFDFKFPSGWGMGQMQASPNGSGFFQLFPVNGGVGCSIEITKYDHADLAKDALHDIRETFEKITKIQDGFEVSLSKAYYSCRINGDHLIQIWYSLPKKKKEHTKTWEQLKNCVSISHAGHPSLQDKEREFLPVVELPLRGWVCNHPNNNLHVIFESYPIFTCTPNKESSSISLLKFKDIKSSGFFYVKWDQTDLDKNEPYQEHLQEMLQDILKIEPNQQVLQAQEFDLKEGYAILRGNPYGLITLSGDGFLFGFAVKSENSSIRYDINDHIKRIKWQKDN